jgi:signal transduction histidine kinase
MSKTLHFKTNTLLKNLIGKDLINDDNIGIIELVKNSYDAGSDHVRLKFESSSPNHASRIIISDNGIGMNEEDIIDKWLNVAYSEKKFSSLEPGAFLAGNKGVGRFSCDRLGAMLDMVTKTKKGDFLHLQINWEDFEIEGDKNLTLQEIDVALDVIDEPKVQELTGIIPKHQGTILIISKLRSEWKRDELISLKRDLEKFINPNQLFTDKKFEIEIDAEEFKEKDSSLEYHKQVNGVIKNLIFNKLKFKTTYIESKIDESGEIINTELFHDGESVFRLEEKNTSFTNLKNIQITLYFLNAYKKAYFTKQTGIRNIDFGSVFMFLNGFRIAPYGERGNDWLGLDSRKTQGQRRVFGNRDIIGRIEVIDRENIFQPVSSREGLKNTAELITLKEKYLISVLRRLERFVINGLDWDSIPDQDRYEIQNSEDLDWNTTSEKYTESWEKKSKRISLAIMTLVGISKDRIIKFWFNTELMKGLEDQRSSEVDKIIKGIENFGGVVDADIKQNLKKFQKILSDKENELKESKRKLSELEVKASESEQELSELKVKADESEQKINVLKKKTETYKAQTLFLESASTLDEKTLLGYHHQICLDTSVIENYLARTMKCLVVKKDIGEALKHIEKIAKANKKITATAQYATRAKFKSGSVRELTDIPAYFDQYLNNVSKEFGASDIKLVINNQIKESFEIKLQRIELSILIDNLVSNSSKAGANNIEINIQKVDDNAIEISFIDDGDGISDSIDIDQVFELGITSTRGSGIGLYHSKQFMQTIGSEIELLPASPKGAKIRMLFKR